MAVTLRYIPVSPSKSECETGVIRRVGGGVAADDL